MAEKTALQNHTILIKSNRETPTYLTPVPSLSSGINQGECSLLAGIDIRVWSLGMFLMAFFVAFEDHRERGETPPCHQIFT